MDKIQASLVHHVRHGMTDDEVLDLIAAALESAPVKPANSKAVAAIEPAKKRKPTKTTNGKGKKKSAAVSTTKASSEEIDRLVLNAIKSADVGIAMGEISKQVGTSSSRASSAVKRLIAAGEVASYGNRRFCRYAVTEELAKQAHDEARGLTGEE